MPVATERPAPAIATRGRLAVLGGEPAFVRPRHVGAPNIPDRANLLRRIDAMLEGRRLANRGPFVRLFEQRIARLVGVRHCIATANGTVALEIAARALDLTGEVIVPAFTFVATPHALRWQGLTPVFCDIDPRTHCLDPRKAEAHVTKRTSAILAVHLWGRPAAVDALADVARRHRLKLFYDAAHAFGCSRQRRMVGGFGDLEVFSFHATKFVGTGEGGAVVTNDDRLAERIRLMQNFGFTGLDTVEALGVNGKMSELAAAFGLTALEHLDAWTAANRRNLALWTSALAPLRGVTVRRWGDGEHRNDQYVVAEVDAEVAGLSRDHLVAALRAENILARRYFHPGCHNMDPYRDEAPPGGWHLPHTDEACRRVMVLPTGTAVSRADIARMAGTMARILDEAPAVAAALAESETTR